MRINHSITPDTIEVKMHSGDRVYKAVEVEGVKNGSFMIIKRVHGIGTFEGGECLRKDTNEEMRLV